jgi:mannitol/fructose-specific phosphotransferase system IIA component (Ntr-type)
MTLADFTSAGLLVPCLEGRNPATILQELTQALCREQRVREYLPFYQAVLHREFLLSTDLEPGIAFPHARVTGVSELWFALGRTAIPVAWSPTAAHPVRLVFLLAVPATDSASYLRVISGLARFAREPQLVEQMHAAQDALQMLAVLRQASVRSNPNPDSTAQTIPR